MSVFINQTHHLWKFVRDTIFQIWIIINYVWKFPKTQHNLGTFHNLQPHHTYHLSYLNVKTLTNSQIFRNSYNHQVDIIVKYFAYIELENIAIKMLENYVAFGFKYHYYFIYNFEKLYLFILFFVEYTGRILKSNYKCIWFWSKSASSSKLQASWSLHIVIIG